MAAVGKNGKAATVHGNGAGKGKTRQGSGMVVGRWQAIVEWAEEAEDALEKTVP